MLAALAVPLAAQQVRIPAPQLESAPSFYDAWIRYRLSLGLALAHSSMKETHRTVDWNRGAAGQTFVGNINKLEEKEMLAVELTLRYDISRFLAIQAGVNTEREIAVWNHDNASSDGQFTFWSLSAGVLLQLPVEPLCCTPYVGLGVEKIFCDFERASWWRTGWHSPSDYNRFHGTDIDRRTALGREMVVEDPPLAFALTLGIACDLWENVSLELFYRKVFADDSDVDVYCDFRTHHHEHTASGSYPLEHSSLGAAVRLWF